MNTKLIGTLAVAAGIAVGGCWYYSPYLALRATKASADGAARMSG